MLDDDLRRTQTAVDRARSQSHGIIRRSLAEIRRPASRIACGTQIRNPRKTNRTANPGKHPNRPKHPVPLQLFFPVKIQTLLRSKRPRHTSTRQPDRHDSANVLQNHTRTAPNQQNGFAFSNPESKRKVPRSRIADATRSSASI